MRTAQDTQHQNQIPTAVVTGSSSGIGRSIACRLSRDGFHVIIHYHSNLDGAKETLNRIREKRGTADIIQFDVSNGQSIDQALNDYFNQVENQNYRLSVLVNNAGIHQDSLLGLMSDAAFNQVIQTNVHGPFYLMRWSIRKMIRERSGCIVNIASLAGQTGNAGQTNYAASKAALIAMTKSLSLEVGCRGIRVNAVAPGLIETEMLRGVPQIEELKKRIPLGRIGSSDDVAGAVSFLCSSDAAYITGHTLSVNGGLFFS